MDIAQLAVDVAKDLTPFLPYLAAGTKAAAEAAGKKFGEAAWNKAAELWGKVKPKADAKTLERIERKPDDPRWEDALGIELEEIFKNDEAFAQAIHAKNSSVAIGGNMENSSIRIIRAENYYEAPQSNAEADPAQKALRDYLKNLRAFCNLLTLAALGDDNDANDDIALDEIYIELDTDKFKEDPEGEADKKNKDAVKKYMREEKMPVSVMEAAAENKRLVLLGDAGSGKSTFVKELCALQADVVLNEGRAKPLAGFDPTLLPVFIELRDLSLKLGALNLGGLSADKQTQELADAVFAEICQRKAADFIPLLKEYFSEGKILLVLDGLDEVPQDMRELAQKAARAVVRLWRVERVIVTSRINSYVGKAVFSDFKDYKIAPLDEEKISKFARKWYEEQKRLGNFTEEEAEKRAQDLAEKAVQKDLIEMASNPMMLTSVAIIHKNGATLPNERARLYSRLVNILANKWQELKTGGDQITPSAELTAFLKNDTRLRETLERLAYETHLANYAAGKAGKDGAKQFADLSRGTVLALLENPEYLGSADLADKFLAYVDQRSGLFIGKGGESRQKLSYNFAHRTIQEYLAGCYVMSKRERKDLCWLHAAEDDFWSMAILMGAEEIIYNNAKALENLLDLIYKLCRETLPKTEQAERAALWSGQIATLIERERIQRDGADGEDYLKRLTAHTVNLLTSDLLPPRERAAAGVTLAQLGDPREGVIPLSLTGEGLGVRANLLFCEIPAGAFTMGSAKDDKDAFDSERPQFEYDIPYNYFMSRYPITNAQFDLFVNDPNGYKNNDWWTEVGLAWRKDRAAPDKYGGDFDLPNHPAVMVRWYEAVAFCKWATGQLQVAGCELQVYNPKTRKSEIVNPKLALSGVEASKIEICLPSEAEWEKAARHSPLPQGEGLGVRVFPWEGSEITPNHANYSATNIGKTSAVGCFPAGESPYGLLDMSGNVWEWQATERQDNYADYLKKENNQLEGKQARVLRGGAFFNGDWALRCASRDRSDPDGWYRSIGFRVVARVSSPISL